jgi:uncharacterized OB-fold protein
MAHPVPVADGLFTWPSDEPRLIGGSCRSCGTTTFPEQASCPRCCGEEMESRLLEARGTLWSFTVQGFRPKPPYAGPDPFEPYGVGYIELPGEVIVESRLTVSDAEQLRIGMPMRLVVERFRQDEEGNDVVTFAFAPERAAGAA